MEKTNNISWKLFLTIAIVIPIVAMAIYYYYDRMIATLPYYSQGNQKVAQEEGAIIPGFSFINQDGTVVNNTFVDNKVWVANYFFSVCPTICPPMMSNLKKVQDAVGDTADFRMISFTVDPKRDVPTVLHHYAQGRQINTSNWQLATGNKKELYRFARTGLFIEAIDGSGEDDDFIHSEKIVLIDRTGHIRGYYDGTDIADINLLLAHIDRLLNPTK